MENRPHFKPGAIKYTRGYGRKVFFSKLVKIIILLIALFIIITTMYIYIKQPARYVTGNEFVFAEPHYKLLQPGDKVIIVETEEYNMFTPIIRFIIPQITYEAEVIAGPYGKIKPTNVENQYIISYANTDNLVSLENIEQEYLDEEYIVRQVDMYGNYSNDIDRLTNKKEILGLKKYEK